MKKSFVLLNVIMSVVILFTILFQSVDSYEHLVKKLAEKQCHHFNENSDQITHQHISFKDCFICNFAFSTFLTFSLNSISFVSSFISHQVKSFFLHVTSYYYNGISYSLRGPPTFLKF